jgi:hypothetical protein
LPTNGRVFCVLDLMLLKIQKDTTKTPATAGVFFIFYTERLKSLHIHTQQFAGFAASIALSSSIRSQNRRSIVTLCIKGEKP